VRGVGSLAAFTLTSTQERDEFLNRMRAKKLLALKSGPRAIRFRLPLSISAAEVDAALERVAECTPVRA
jgi:L-lysine 6-transaminase